MTLAVLLENLVTGVKSHLTSRSLTTLVALELRLAISILPEGLRNP